MPDITHEIVDEVDYYCTLKQGWGAFGDRYCRYCGEKLVA